MTTIMAATAYLKFNILATLLNNLLVMLKVDIPMEFSGKLVINVIIKIQKNMFLVMNQSRKK